MRIKTHVPMMGLAAWSGAGKTTLLKGLLPLLRARGLRVGVVKHAHHEFDIDLPGKDSYELRKAGATQVLVGSRKRWALVVETELTEDPSLAELLAHLGGSDLDLILIEGLKHEPIAKIEVHRPGLGRPLLCETDASVVAVAVDAPVTLPRQLPLLDLNDPYQIVEFIVDRLKLDDQRVPLAETATQDS